MLEIMEPVAKSGYQAAVNSVAIEVQNLYRSYHDKKAVDGVSFAVRRGEIFGILGPNGAGKTTTLEIIEGLRDPDAKANTVVLVDGLDIHKPKERAEVHQRIGLQLQSSTFFEELTVRENLEMLCQLYRKASPVKSLLQEFDLVEKANARIGTLSGGQQQRVSLAAAMINDPSIIFLDEPTTALDPQARRNVWDSIRRWQQAGKTLVLTTHYMEEAEKLCDRVAIMEDGRIVALGTPAQLIGQYANEQIIGCRIDQTPNSDFKGEFLQNLPHVTSVTSTAEGYKLHTSNLSTSLVALLNLTEREHVVISEITTHAPTLEDVFINLTGRKLRD
jgi:ABC-2 type transport system ATP-binding protein